MELHDKRFPNESREYRTARNELLELESALREQIENVAARRRELPMTAIKEDYVFQTMESDGTVGSIKLSEAFGPGKNDIIVYSYMFSANMDAPCPMCTSLIDGLDASAPHVTNRVDMVVVAKSPIERILDVARDRHWNHIRCLSSHQNTYNADYWAEDGDENQMPMVNVFTKRDDDVYHFWGSELLYVPRDGQPRHVDLLWPLWNLFDLTPRGRGQDWHPKLAYD